MNVVRWLVCAVVVLAAGAATAGPVPPVLAGLVASVQQDPLAGRVLGQVEGRTLVLTGELRMLGGAPTGGYGLATMRPGELELDHTGELLDADLSARGELAVVTLEGQLLIGPPGQLDSVDTGGQFVSQVRWDPLGDRLALTLWPPGRTPWDIHRAATVEQMATAQDADIALLSLLDGGLLVITDVDAHDYNPVWSPAGDELLFVSTRTGYASFFVTTADGDADRQLTNLGAEYGAPAIPVALSGHCFWDTTTDLIVYETRDRQGRAEVWTLTPDGEGRRHGLFELLGVAAGHALLRDSTTVTAVELGSWAEQGGAR